MRLFVAAADPDGTDEIVYSLTEQPSGMTIDPSTGLIEWIPTELHKLTAHRVEVKVANRNDLAASGTQTFSINVAPSPPKKATLAVMDGYDHQTRKRLSASGTIGLVQASDNKHQVISAGSYIAYDFAELKQHLGAILSRLDHICLNDIPPFDTINPSSENLAATICDELKLKLAGAPVSLSGVQVWESPQTGVTYSPD